MQVIKAKTLGCCAGVKFALNAVEKLSANPNLQIFTFGDIIHNQILIKKLKDRKILRIDESNLDELKVLQNACVLIRAHGVSPSIRRKIEKTGAKIVDATCHRVLLSQKKAIEFAKNGYSIILVGEKQHAELLGIFGFATENLLNPQKQTCIIIENVEEAKTLANLPEKVAVISQTTIRTEEFVEITNILCKKIKNLKICNMICPATQERQKAVDDLAKICQAIIVVGGKSSANTKRLASFAKTLCKNVIFVENANELPEKIDFECVGIVSGASTLDEQIDEVEKKLKEMA